MGSNYKTHITGFSMLGAGIKIRDRQTQTDFRKKKLLSFNGNVRNRQEVSERVSQAIRFLDNSKREWSHVREHQSPHLSLHVTRLSSAPFLPPNVLNSHK